MENYEIAKKLWLENREAITKEIIKIGDMYHDKFNPVKSYGKATLKPGFGPETILNHKPENAEVIPGYLAAAKNDPVIANIWQGVLMEDITDCIFDPWLNFPEYQEYISENGNEDNETSFISNIFISVLIQANYEKYLSLIMFHQEINVNGL